MALLAGSLWARGSVLAPGPPFPDDTPSFAEFSGVLHQCHILASEMVHFIHQMQYYITFEVSQLAAVWCSGEVSRPPQSLHVSFQVLECSWDELWNRVQQAQDLDHIIAAHEAFLNTITSRCLLDSNSRVRLTPASQDGDCQSSGAAASVTEKGSHTDCQPPPPRFFFPSPPF